MGREHSPSAEIMAVRKREPKENLQKGSVAKIPREIALCIGLGLLILIFYANSFTAGLAFDSEVIVKMDPRLRAASLTNLENIFAYSYWWPDHESVLYRPLTTLSYMFNYAVLGNR